VILELSPLKSDALRQRLPEFVPEVRLRDKFSLSALQKAPLSPKAVIVNFCELMQIGRIRSHIALLRRVLGGVRPLIFSAVGRDHLLDELDMRQYHKAAVELGADWVISPDDYVYQADSGYSFYQNAHFSRALGRALALTRLGRDKYRVVGLAIGSSFYQLREFVRALAEQGIDTFAYPCGDLLKRARNPKSELIQISEFVHYLQGLRYRCLLLGINSPRLVRQLKPDMWASGAWSFDASRGVYYSSDGTPVRGRELRCGHKECAATDLSSVERMTLHNLIARARLSWNEGGP